MARKRIFRKIVTPPAFKGFKPYGCSCTNKESIHLLYEEYEAIKLADYDLMNHSEAGKLMGVSRATFARIYESARRKIATAFAETREIISVFGQAVLENGWLFCKDCNSHFTNPFNQDKIKCPVCGSENLISSDNILELK